MVDVYFYIKTDELEETVTCGRKLSEKADREQLVNDEMKKCFIGYLNPKDKMEKYDSKDFICIRASLQQKYVYIGESKLYTMGLTIPEAMELYNKMLIPVDDYIFGSYRSPECIVISTLIGESLEEADNVIGAPVLVENTEDLYLEKIILEYADANSSFKNDILYTYYNWLVAERKADVLHSTASGVDAFTIRETGKCILLERPKKD